MFEKNGVSLMRFFLKMEMKQDCGIILNCQKKYEREITNKFHMEEYKCTASLVS